MEYIMNSVQQERIKRGATQEELAQAVGVSRQTISAVEKGNYTPSVLLALNLSHYFKVPVEKLFTIRHGK